MIRLAANLSMLFTEVPFLHRFAAAAACGFKGVEFLYPYEHPAKNVAAALQEADLTQALFNAPPGNLEAGERGLAAIPGRERDFIMSLDLVMEYAVALHCPRVHVMAGIAPDGVSRDEMQRVYENNLRLAAVRFTRARLEAVIEPINHRDIPGYHLNTTQQAIETIKRVGMPNVKLQLDLYHCQITEGDLAHHVRGLAGRYTHVQIAGNPDRNEPDRGEVDYGYVLSVLDESGYDGWVGCEYRPRAGTVEGLGWAHPYGIDAR